MKFSSIDNLPPEPPPPEVRAVMADKVRNMDRTGIPEGFFEGLICLILEGRVVFTEPDLFALTTIGVITH